MMAVISQEVRLPLLSMSLALHEGQNIQTLRHFVDQLRLAIDSLISGEALSVAPPRREEVFAIAPLVEQIEHQVRPLVEAEAVELVTDVASAADVRVIADRFRLRTVIHNLLRSLSHYSTGERVWLNVHAEPALENGKLMLVIDAESSHAPASSSLKEVVSVAEEFMGYDYGHVGLGLQVAHQWLKQMDGQLEWFQSPRGGDGLRVMLPVEVVGSQMK
jgi:C4-dicarboxylate-specific signal transduction histidine kinase